MKNDDVRIDKFYDGIETHRANGLLYILFLWLIAFNPTLIFLTGFPVNDFLAVYLSKFGFDWYLGLRPIVIGVLVIMAIAGILLGIGINLLKKPAWKLLRVYFPLLQAIYLALLIPAFPLLEAVYKAGFFDLQPEEKHNNYLATFTTMLVVSSVIFVLVSLYLLRSKKAKETFYPPKNHLN